MIDIELQEKLNDIKLKLVTIEQKEPKNNIACEKLIARYTKELERLESIYIYEKNGYNNGANYICGIDEVGRGPLAGPVVTCAIIMKPNVLIQGVNDSKKVSEKKRETLFDIILDNSVDYAIGMVSEIKIDEINILNATKTAMKNAVMQLKNKPDLLLIDAVKLPELNIPTNSIIKGDELSFSIACASIIAKVTRDNMMNEYDNLYPQYGFAQNKGYGTKQHIDAIKQYGICPIHRKSFLTSICI